MMLPELLAPGQYQQTVLVLAALQLAPVRHFEVLAALFVPRSGPPNPRRWWLCHLAQLRHEPRGGPARQPAEDRAASSA